MNHPFYSKTKKEQNRIQLVIALCSITIILVSGAISILIGIYPIGIITFIVVLSIIAPFFDVPSLVKSGKMMYFSPLFLTEKPKNGVINIHGGTLFDYYFVIDTHMNGAQRTTFIIQQYLQGLLSLIEKHQDDKQMKIRGTSYIINERTAKKIGLTITKTDFLQKVVLTYNYANILISNSIAKNKLSFPQVSNTKTFEATISDLLEHKDYIEKLNTSLKSTLANKA